MAKYVNKFNMVGAPFAFKNYAATDAFFAGDFIKWVTPDVEKSGFKYLARWEYGFRNYTTSKRQLNKPEDMKGLKIRTPPDFVNSATVKALGGIAQTIAFSELPMALKQGVVDGQENPIATIYSNQMWETQKYLSILNYTYNSTHLVMNKAAFEKLSPDQQKIVLDEARKAGDLMRKTIRDEEASQVAALKSKGMEVAIPDTTPFIAAASSVYDELKSKVGEADYKTFMSLLEKSK
jgi:tripartite ATP-independent transporter DctP family solute receptor